MDDRGDGAGRSGESPGGVPVVCGPGATPAQSGPRSAARATATDGDLVSRAPKQAGPAASAHALVDQLVATFAEQVRRALGVSLDGSEASLAFVDHYLRTAQEEDRLPILTLLASGAGAYYGELVRKEIGASWIGDGRDPRRLRLLLTHQFLHFSPVDQALEAIAGRSLDPDDPRIPEGPEFDPSFCLTPPRPRDLDEDDDAPLGEHDEDAQWLQERLSELSPMPEDEFVSLTCRFETLKLMLELLAAKHVSEGKRPREYTLNDYLAELSKRPTG